MIRCQITDGRFAQDREGWFRKLRSDVDFIQIRERDLSARDLAALVRQVTRSIPVRILVNDRIDVALACGAAGVHLRSGSISPGRVKRLAPLMVTVAVHDEAELRESAGADFAILAPVFRPLSKPDYRPALGLETLRRLAASSPTSILALGGITAENAGACVEAGAAGVAGITCFDQREL